MKSTQREIVGAALEAARAYRRPSATGASPKRRTRLNPSPKPAGTPRDDVAEASLPGVPDEWTRGVRALAAMACPARIEPQRWAVYVATAGRLLRDHGADLHAARWTTAEVFGLHQVAPSTHCPGWGLVWLLDTAGTVLDVSEAEVGMQRQPGGTRMGFRKRSGAGAVPAWELPE